MSSYPTCFPYYGGKTNYIDAILGRFPKHRVYVEPFGGSGTVLLNKTPSDVEVYNDIDSELVNFFRVLRDKEKFGELWTMLDLTPYSREEYNDCCDKQDPMYDKRSLTDIERARSFYTMLRQAYGGKTGHSGWKVTPTANNAGTWRDSILRLSIFHERLARVHIDNKTFERVMIDFDEDDALFYCDPPYVMSTRSGGKAYRNEMTDFDHTVFLRYVQRCKAKVIISGYHSEKYDRELKDWQVVEISTKASVGQKNQMKDSSRVEVLWIKPNAIRQDGLWDHPPLHLVEVSEASKEI